MHNIHESGLYVHRVASVCAQGCGVDSREARLCDARTTGVVVCNVYGRIVHGPPNKVKCQLMQHTHYDAA